MELPEPFLPLLLLILPLWLVGMGTERGQMWCGGCSYTLWEAASAKPECLPLLLVSKRFRSAGKCDVNHFCQILEKSLLATRYSLSEKQKLETIFSILISEAAIFKYLLDLHSCKGVSIYSCSVLLIVVFLLLLFSSS